MNDRFIASALSSLLCAVLVSFIGCEFIGDPVQPVINKSVQQDPIIIVDKGKNLIQFDVQHEAGVLVAMQTAKRESYLMEQAFAYLDHKKMENLEHKKTTRCIAKIVLLTAKDNYNKPIWGSAAPIAEFEFS